MASHIEYEHKFKVFRLADWTEIENILNNFSLGGVEDVHVAMPDYRIIVLIVRYMIEHEVQDPEPKPATNKKAEAKSDSATK